MKIKKIVSGALVSLIAFSGLTMLSDSNMTSNKSDKSNTDNSNNDFNTENTDSLGKLLALNNITEDNSASENINEFAINEADYDADNGILTVESTQLSYCLMKVKFVSDDEDKKTVLKKEVRLEKGSNTVSEIDIEKELLPEYYTVSVCLVDLFSQEKILCEEYLITKYTRNIQEIVNSSVDDYNPDYVINLDYSDDTNFIVLNEDTHFIDSTEFDNKVVSADFQNGVYEFENINDEIKNLRENDFIYVPYEDNKIIAVCIETITKNDDGTATVVENHEKAEDVFDFVKIDTATSSEEAVLDVSDSELSEISSENVSIVNNLNNIKLNAIPRMLSAGSDDTDGAMSITPGASFSAKFEYDFIEKKANFDLSEKPTEPKDTDEPIEVKKSLKISGSLSVSVSANVEFYKRWNYKYIKIGLTTTYNMTDTISASISAQNTVSKFDVTKFKPDDLKTTDKESAVLKIGKLEVPTPIAGVNFIGDISFVVEVSGTGTFETSSKLTNTMEYNSDVGDKWQTTSKKTKQVTGAINGSVFAGVRMSAGVAILHEKICSAKISLEAGFQVSGTLAEGNLYDSDSDATENSFKLLTPKESVSLIVMIQKELKISEIMYLKIVYISRI